MPERAASDSSCTDMIICLVWLFSHGRGARGNNSLSLWSLKPPSAVLPAQTTISSLVYRPPSKLPKNVMFHLMA